jgi:hypothetical protein
MKNDKSLQKKYIQVGVLLIIYTVFLIQQVVSNRVICYKADGSSDLEMVNWGLQCECKDKNHNGKCNDKNHLHKEENHNRPENGEKNGMCAALECCFDVPVDDRLLKKKSGANLRKSTSIRFYDVRGGKETLLLDLFIAFHKQVPLSKFLIPSLFQCGTVILRC